MYGPPIVMNYATMYEYAVDHNSPQFKAPFNQLKNEPNVFTYKDTAIVTPNIVRMDGLARGTGGPFGRASLPYMPAFAATARFNQSEEAMYPLTRIIGALQQFAVTQQFSRFRSEADIQRAAPTEPSFMSTRPWAKPASKRAAATAG
jgi:hypothetical protein